MRTVKAFAVAGAAVAVLAATACGTTVRLPASGTSASGAASQNGLVAPAGGRGPAVHGGAAAAPSGATGQTGPDGAAAGSSARRGSVGTTTGSAAGGAAVAQVGPGVTSTTINIGLTVTDNSKAAAAALGASGAGVGGGDAEAQYRIVINDINAHGGVLGRKLNPVVYHYDATSTDSIDQQESAACAAWTQDTKILGAVAAEASESDTLTRCLDKAGAFQVWTGLTSSDLSTYRQFPYYVEVSSLDVDRMVAGWPAELRGRGYFGRWDFTTGAPSTVTPVKVGIISFDDAASTRAVTSYLEPALKAFGYPFEYARVLYPKGEADNGTTISQIQNVVLKFRSDGVSHVLPVESEGAGVGGFFASGASSQHYYPRFGLNSGNGAQVLVGAGIWPKDELAGSMGYGWIPLADVNYSDDPTNGPDSNASRQHCVKLMRDHGQTVSDTITERQVVEACDSLYFLAAALQRGGAANRDGFLSGVTSLAGGFGAGETFATYFSGSRHDGVATGRPFAYVASCTCFRYDGARFRIE